MVAFSNHSIDHSVHAWLLLPAEHWTSYSNGWLIRWQLTRAEGNERNRVCNPPTRGIGGSDLDVDDSDSSRRDVGFRERFPSTMIGCSNSGWVSSISWSTFWSTVAVGSRFFLALRFGLSRSVCSSASAGFTGSSSVAMGSVISWFFDPPSSSGCLSCSLLISPSIFSVGTALGSSSLVIVLLGSRDQKKKVGSRT